MAGKYVVAVGRSSCRCLNYVDREKRSCDTKASR